MKLNELMMLKLVSFILCDNIYLRLVILIIIFLEIFKVKNKGNICIKDIVMGTGIICLNRVININFIVVNFIVLTIISFLFNNSKIEKIISLYFWLFIIKGVVEFAKVFI